MEPIKAQIASGGVSERGSKLTPILTFGMTGRLGIDIQNAEISCPKNPDPSKVANLRTYTPLRHTGSNRSIGGFKDS